VAKAVSMIRAASHALATEALDEAFGMRGSGSEHEGPKVGRVVRRRDIKLRRLDAATRRSPCITERPSGPGGKVASGRPIQTVGARQFTRARCSDYSQAASCTIGQRSGMVEPSGVPCAHRHSPLTRWQTRVPRNHDGWQAALGVALGFRYTVER
jgi:hypothetical protein